LQKTKEDLSLTGRIKMDMAAEGVRCDRCGEPFLSHKDHERLLAVSKRIGLSTQSARHVLCLKCRRLCFAEQLIGDCAGKGDRLRPISERRQEHLPAVRTDPRLGTTVYKTECFICNQGCDAAVHVRDGAVVRVEGDTGSEVTKGTLCAKGLASKDILYHPGRLLYPMRRAGARGEGKWERITWDRAFDTIVDNLQSIEEHYGGESILLATGTNRGWVRYFNRFANAYGKQWIGPGIAQCFYPRMTGQTLVLGTNAMENPNYRGTRCMIIWGCNPTNTWPVKGKGMMEAWRRGAKMIVIDPLFTEAASKADLWLQLRPGTDAALALGMLHVIQAEGLYDREFVDRWCSGFGRLTARLKEYPPERVEQITWVTSELIREAARLYATARPASITQCLSIDQNADTISSSRSIAMLAAVTGNIDVAGGNLITMLAKGAPVPDETGKGFLSEEHHRKRLGSAQYPFLAGESCILAPSAHNHAVWKAMLTGKPYPVKAVYCHGSNMLLSYPNTKRVTEALMNLDFLVVADLFLTETAALADVVLPAASWMERSSVTRNEQTSIDHLHLQQKVVQRGECRSDVAILNELARRLGFGDRMFSTEEAYFDFVLRSSGLTFQEFKDLGGATFPHVFKKYESGGFRTPSGKVHLYDERLLSLGYDPLPEYREPSEGPVSTPALAREYPLILTTGGRVPVFRHTELRNIRILREIVPQLEAALNPKTAKELAVDEGETVIVESPRGSMEVKVQVTEGIDPRVIQIPSHWPGINNVNLLTDHEKCAPMIGSAQLRCQVCRIRKK
jgi:anaerobic selenocysteine-containing dehydrogenase